MKNGDNCCLCRQVLYFYWLAFADGPCNVMCVPLTGRSYRCLSVPRLAHAAVPLVLLNTNAYGKLRNWVLVRSFEELVAKKQI